MFLFIFQKDVIFCFSCIDFNCSNGSHGSNYRVGMYAIIRWISCFYAEFNFLCYCIYWQPYILFFCYTNYYCSFCTEEREIEAKSGFTVLLSVTPLISVWLTLVIVVFCINSRIDSMMGVMLLASMAFLLGMNFVVFWAYDSDQKFMRNYLMMQADLKEQQAEAEYYRRLAEQTENQKILIHDIKNHLQTIAGLSEDGGESKIHEYVQQLMEMPEMKSSVTYCSQPVLNVILGQYQEICKKKSIQFGVDIRKDSVDYITVDDLTALFGNLLKMLWKLQQVCQKLI